MRFDDPSPSGRAKKPPNYMSRRMQWQLLMLVFSLMLVLVLMERARDPNMYAWMWGNQEADDEVDEMYEIDLRKDKRPAQNSGAAQEKAPQKDTEPADQRWQAAVKDAWQYVLDQLSRADLDVVADSLMKARQPLALDASAGSDLASLIDEMDQHWDEYLTTAQTNLASRSETSNDDDLQWQEIVTRLSADWNSAVGPALRDLAAGQTLDSADVFHQLQHVLDAKLLENVEDNTIFTPKERTAWFRWLEKLQTQDIDRDAQLVSYLQLFRQSNVYRGQLVRLRGSIQSARWIAAEKNFVGIDAYAELWMSPKGASAPIVVYSLQLPAGFPKISDKRKGELPTKLNLPVEITGLFFKRHAYPAIHGMDVAPLLLARAPRLTVAPRPQVTTSSSSNVRLVIVTICIVVLVGTVAIVALTRKEKREPLPDRLDLKKVPPAK